MASGTDANPEVTLASLESARATLGIPSFASRDEARRAYRALARAFHPDKGGDVNRFREVRKAHERLEAAWNASAVRRSRDESAADDPTVASPETKRDDGSPPATAEPNPVAPTRDLEALAAEALDAGDFERARDVLDAVIARALADESEGRESLSASPDRQKKKKPEPPGRSPRRFSLARARARARETGRRRFSTRTARSRAAACGSSRTWSARRRWSGWGGTERRRRATRSTRSARTKAIPSRTTTKTRPPRRFPSPILLTILRRRATTPTTTTTTTTTTTGRRVVTGTTAGTTAVASIVPRRRGTRSTTS